MFAIVTSEQSVKVGYDHGEWQVHTATKNEAKVELLFSLVN